MAWNIIYFIISIGAALLGIWHLAQKRYVFLSVACLVWFLVVLFTFIIPAGFMNYTLLPQATIGALLTFLVFPVLLILAFFGRRS
ncbi:MAG TPA: hypothetical protein ENN69_00480 [Spirochaetia bacterium]|nr:hypothetical protein [Spirochaetia bacterium]